MYRLVFVRNIHSIICIIKIIKCGSFCLSVISYVVFTYVYVSFFFGIFAQTTQTVVIVVQLLGFYLMPQMLEVDFLIAMLYYLSNQFVDHCDPCETVTYCQIVKEFAECYLLWGSEND